MAAAAWRRRPIPVTDLAQAAEARREASALAAAIGFDEAGAGRVALVVTEAATNLVKHAGGGEVLVRRVDDEGDGIEIIVLDQGPGMANVAECRRDGFSTAGSPGTGLGAIARLADVVEIHSVPGRGTALLARLWPARRRPAPEGWGLAVGAVLVPRRGEDACGDGWAVCRRPHGGALLVADGLGHGPLAAAASQEAVRVFSGRHEGPAASLRAAHEALRATRGAAVAVCDVDCGRGLVTFAGVGNVSGVIVDDGASRSLVSHSGIVGQQMRAVREFTYPWPEAALLVLHSDGLTAHWSLDAYPGLARRHPSLIAGVLYRDFQRGRDDVAVVVAKRRPDRVDR